MVGVMLFCEVLRWKFIFFYCEVYELELDLFIGISGDYFDLLMVFGSDGGDGSLYFLYISFYVISYFWKWCW